MLALVTLLYLHIDIKWWSHIFQNLNIKQLILIPQKQLHYRLHAIKGIYKQHRRVSKCCLYSTPKIKHFFLALVFTEDIWQKKKERKNPQHSWKIPCFLITCNNKGNCERNKRLTYVLCCFYIYIFRKCMTMEYISTHRVLMLHLQWPCDQQLVYRFKVPGVL